MLPGVEVGRDRERQHEDGHGRRQRTAAIRPMDRPEQAEDRPTSPHEPGHVPGQQSPRREEREHPRGVDVGQERAGRGVRVAAVEPDPDAGPVGPGIGPGQLAPGDETGTGDTGHGDQDRDGQDPARFVEPRDLAAQRPLEDTGAKIRDRVILSRFVALAGGSGAMIPQSSRRRRRWGFEAGEATYRSLFLRPSGPRPSARPCHVPEDRPTTDVRPGLAEVDRRLPHRREPAPPVLDDRWHAPGGCDARAVPARCGRRRHVGRRLGHVQSHDRVRGVGGHAQAPDGPDRGRSGRAPGRDRRPAFPAAQQAHPGVLLRDRRPISVTPRPRGRRGHGRRRRAGPRHGGHRPRQHHHRRRRELGHGRVGGASAPPDDDPATSCCSLPAGYRFDLRRRERVATPGLHALPGAEAASS